MAYTKNTWETNKVITADGLNHIEIGIETNSSNIENNASNIATNSEDISTINSTIGNESTNNTILYKIKTNANNISTINSQIGSDSTKNTILYNIKNNTSNITTNTENITDITSRIETLENINKNIIVHNENSAKDTIKINGNVTRTQPIELELGQSLILNGTLNYTGNDAAIIIKGDKIKILGAGSIQSSGKYVIKTTANISYANIDLAGTLVLNSNSNITDRAFIYFNNKIVNCVLKNLSLYYGQTENQPIGIQINGEFTKNLIDNITFSNCSKGIVINSTTKNNFFRKLNCNSNILKSTIDSLVENVFEINGTSISNNSIELKNANNNNTFIFSSPIKASVFKISNGSVSLNESLGTSANIIQGIIKDNDNKPLFYNPSFSINGNKIVLDASNSLGTVKIDAITHTFNYDTASNFPGYDNYYLKDLTSFTLYLNNLSDWNHCPLNHFILNKKITQNNFKIYSGSNAQSTLLYQNNGSDGQLKEMDVGWYVVFYNAPNQIRIRKML